MYNEEFRHAYVKARLSGFSYEEIKSVLVDMLWEHDEDFDFVEACTLDMVWFAECCT